MSVMAANTTNTMVNGFQCKNCTDIDYAKRHIDPAHPKDGPYGVDAQPDPARPAKDSAFRLDGALAGVQPAGRAAQTGFGQTGRLVSLSV